MTELRDAIASAARRLVEMADEAPALISREVGARTAMHTWGVAAYLRHRDWYARQGFASVYEAWQQAHADASWCLTGMRCMAVRLACLVLRARGQRPPDAQLALRQRRSPGAL